MNIITYQDLGYFFPACIVCWVSNIIILPSRELTLKLALIFAHYNSYQFYRRGPWLFLKTKWIRKRKNNSYLAELAKTEMKKRTLFSSDTLKLEFPVYWLKTKAGSVNAKMSTWKGKKMNNVTFPYLWVNSGIC